VVITWSWLYNYCRINKLELAIWEENMSDDIRKVGKHIVRVVTSDEADAMQSFDIENSTAYSYYRIFILDGYDSTNVGFGMINLLERYMA
jgi:hypothetical protein